MAYATLMLSSWTTVVCRGRLGDMFESYASSISSPKSTQSLPLSELLPSARLSTFPFPVTALGLHPSNPVSINNRHTTNDELNGDTVRRFIPLHKSTLTSSLPFLTTTTSVPIRLLVGCCLRARREERTPRRRLAED